MQFLGLMIGGAEHLFYSEKKRQGEGHVNSGCGSTAKQNRMFLDFHIVSFCLMLEATDGVR